MKPLTLDDLVDIDRYEAVRRDYRARVLAHKRDRRIAVGDRVTLTFEDRETVRYQVQEMARIERIRGAEALQHELDAYNDLVPGNDELSATLFIEIPELAKIRPELDRLIGIDEHVSLVLGSGDVEDGIAARFDDKQMEEDRISAVHYIRFPLASQQVQRLRDGDAARLRIDHPNYRAEVELPPALRASLTRDLDDETPVLLDPAAVPAAAATPEIVFESATVRALRLPGDDLLVEPIAPVASLAAAEPALLAEILPVVQRFAAEIAERCGGCRVETEVRREPDARLRIRLAPTSS